MRHIKVRATLSADMKEVTVQVIEQSHLGYDFSEKGMSNNHHHSGCFKHSNIVLVSLEEWHTVGVVSNFDGDYNVILTADFKPFKVPIALWPQVKAAFEAYNEWGKDN